MEARVLRGSPLRHRRQGGGCAPPRVVGPRRLRPRFVASRSSFLIDGIAPSPPDRDPTPPERVVQIWRNAQAVCFDVDCTVCKNDGIDELAAFLDKEEEVARWTSQAMDGSVDLTQSLEERMRILSSGDLISDVQEYLRTCPAEDRLNPGIRELVSALHDRGVAVYLISGGFREMCLPVARILGIEPSNVYANRMLFTADDATGLPTKFAGFDRSEPTSRQGGKPEVIRNLRAIHPYETVVMVGDGITDLEAAAVEGGADIFIGYCGTVLRPEIAEAADWLLRDFGDLSRALTQYKVAFVGSGAWACAAAKLAASNVLTHAIFDPSIAMYVYEEEWEGGLLTCAINETHVNPKYLPGVFLGENVKAEGDLVEAVKDANVIVFCCPHEFAHQLCNKLQGHVRKDAIAISLTKGMRIRPEGPQLISEMVRRKLGIDCSVLMGANIAGEIGAGELSEATIGYRVPENAKVFKALFQTPTFIVAEVQDVEGAEMAGTLKNIVAVGSGICDGLGYGSNTKAAIIRRGLIEMKQLASRMFPSVRPETWTESCGVADLVASCYGGRNRRVAAAFAENGGEKSMETLAQEMLNGQKLQGKLTADEVHAVLKRNQWEADFPLFTTIHLIVNGKLPCSAITSYF